MQVPFVDLKPQYLEAKAEIDAAVMGVVEEHAFVLGPEVRAFEEEAAAYLGVKHAIGVANGSDALYLALLALGVGPGDEVVTVPHTYIATPEAIHRVGAKIVFCAIDESTWNMSAKALEAAITDKTKAIIPVDIFGQCYDNDALRAVAGDIPFVEDAAQAWGSSIGGKKAGSLGDISTFSFYPTKTLGAMGDGGMVATNSDEHAATLRALRVHGESKRYFNNLHGMNSRLDSIQAAILRVKLRHVDGWNDARREIANYYYERFEGSKVKLHATDPNGVHVWHQCVALVERRDELRAYLQEKGVGTNVFYPVPQHLQACYADLGYKEGDFPVTESISANGVALPCWPQMTDEMRAYVADSVLAFYA